MINHAGVELCYEDPNGVILRLRVAELSLHPACELVPEMSPTEWSEFLADVGRRGIQEPLVVQGRQILDGRHRWRAAQAADVETLPVRIVELSPEEQTRYVIAATLHRRQLSEAQRVVMAAKYRETLVKESKEKRATSGAKTRWSSPIGGECLADTPSAKNETDQKSEQEKRAPAPHKQRRERAEQIAARHFGVPERKVKAASVVIQTCHPLVIAAYERGEITINCAKALAAYSLHQQEKWAKAGAMAMKQAARSAPVPPREQHVAAPAAARPTSPATAKPAADGDRTPAAPPAAQGNARPAAPAASPMLEEFKRRTKAANGENADRKARVERLSLIKKLEMFLHELTGFRGELSPDEALAEWPENDIDHVFDLVDQIEKELTLWDNALTARN